MLSSRLFRLTGVDDLDGVCPSLTCSFPSLLVRLLLRSVAVSAADDDDAVDLSDLLLADLLFFVLLFAAEGPGLVDRVILSFFFFFLLSFFGLGSLAHVIGRGGRLMVTTRAPLLPALLLDRRDDAFDATLLDTTLLVTSEGVRECVDESHMSASADDRLLKRGKRGISHRRRKKVGGYNEPRAPQPQISRERGTRCAPFRKEAESLGTSRTNVST